MRKLLMPFIVQFIICLNILANESYHTTAFSQLSKNLTVSDGLPNNEVRQLIELPNGQILVNCEGTFCLYNGQHFMTLPCDKRQAYLLPHFTDGYAHYWEADSLLWLRDFYRIYLFDARSRRFMPISSPLRKDISSKMIAESTDIGIMADSAHVPYSSITATCKDRQGGTWLGTRDNGIFYIPPTRPQAESIPHDPELMRRVRGVTDSKGRLWICNQNGLDCYKDGQIICHYDQGNVSGLIHSAIQFIYELPDGRLLLCNKLNHLGYFSLEQKLFTPLSRVNRAVKDKHRNIVGACSLSESNRVAVYTQNGAFVLDTKADTLSAFMPAEVIDSYSDKYNCMLTDKNGRLWIGTQNGLFKVENDTCRLVTGLRNNCIRCLAEDDEGDIWIGTSCGLSRIRQQMVANYGPDDGIPEISMLERCALNTADGRIVFVQGGRLLIVRPKLFIGAPKKLNVVLVGLEICQQTLTDIPSSVIKLSYNENYLNLQFSALNYATPHHTRYRYRLSGIEQEWQYAPGNSGLCTVSYNALAPGRYTFEAQATLENDDWGPVMQKTFIINPPLWLTWWAKVLYILFAATVTGYAIHIYLKRRKTKMERENDLRVNHLFELREEARHQFAQNVNIDASKIAVNGEEKRLVDDMLKAIENNMGDDSYNVDLLARDVAMSRTKLYQKVQNMLGITPTDFIRNVRLKRAAQLLAETSLTVGEVACRVGFATPRNFSTQFKKMFGVLPNEYKQDKSNN